jgi:sulfide:quinone oxidoreductase
MRVVVVGAGVAGLEFLLALAELAPQRAEVEVVAPESAFAYRPFAVAETFGVGPGYRLELDQITSQVGAHRRRGRVTSIDPAGRLATLASGEQLLYDLLVIACGATPEEAVPGALTFRGEEDEEDFRELLRELDEGSVREAAFVVPPGASWPLPLYELALMTATRLRQHGRTGWRLALVTPEASPLVQFEARASEAVAELLEAAGIDVQCGRYADQIIEGELRLVPDGSLPAERVVALPRLRGPQLTELPCDTDGFIPTDLRGAVRSVPDAYAAGDATSFPIKHGGIAVQQADVIAATIAARLGARVRPTTFRPILRGLLLTGEMPRFLQAKIGGGQGETSAVSVSPLWWPPSKIAGGRLARALRDAGLPVPPPPGGPGALSVEIELPADPGEPASKPLLAGNPR